MEEKQQRATLDMAAQQQGAKLEMEKQQTKQAQYNSDVERMSKFLTMALDKDIAVRLRFSAYFSNVTLDQDARDNWLRYHKYLVEQQEAEASLERQVLVANKDRDYEMVARLQTQLEAVRQVNRPSEISSAAKVTTQTSEMEQLILSTCRENNVTDVGQLAYVLATINWETAQTMLPLKEGFWQSEQWRKENLAYYPYYGRGFVMLTWKKNYEAFGKMLNLDLSAEPDKALEPVVAAKIACIGLRDGLFTGRKLSDYIGEGKEDFFNARRIVGGLDKTSQIATLAVQYMQKLR